MSSINTKPQYLPCYFKKISFGLIIFSILLFAFSTSKILTIEKEIIQTISKVILLLSLLLLALTKNKIEDELTYSIRLKAFATSFIFGVTFTIVSPFANLLFEGILTINKGAFELLILMFSVYFAVFYSMKKNR
ncbi:hypothetical protein MHL31_02590 [Lutibacter sp. A80]|uniref:hypothetical protein n=1 Tax=Lutibacter sp. A80 TaxID=2918453 RepID=UPI001F05A8EB|nr:hypothetical protein [Lutibacter sp. A80]UMB61099.1 hypothetical protein MHL31_02590 [Lutibacter sp. A80]